MINNLSAVSGENTLLVVFIVLFAIVLIALIVVTTLLIKSKGKNLPRAAKVRIKNNTRYSVEDNIANENDTINITYQEEDFDLVIGRTYVAKKGGKLMPGKYTILSANAGCDKFNIRFGGFVREFSHGDTIVISEGDSISSVSHSLVLR